jgi:hypothetical protein
LCDECVFEFFNWTFFTGCTRKYESVKPGKIVPESLWMILDEAIVVNRGYKGVRKVRKGEGNRIVRRGKDEKNERICVYV